MLIFGPVAFLAPLLLLGLVVLPVLWWLLRAVPPAAVRERFPGVRLLLGLKDPEQETDRTPWWLLLLRLMAIAAVIVGFAQPILNLRLPDEPGGGEGPLLILFDGGWASAPDWPDRIERARQALDTAQGQGRPVTLHMLTDTVPNEMMPIRAAEEWQGILSALEPAPWQPDRIGFADQVEALMPDQFDTLWLQTGLEEDTTLLAVLMDHGAVTILRPATTARAVRPLRLVVDGLSVDVARAETGVQETRGVTLYGLDPNGIERVVARQDADFDPEDRVASVMFEVPAELRNRVTRAVLDTARSAGGVTLADDAARRREVGLVAAAAVQETDRLRDPLHYLRTALAPDVDLVERPLLEVIPANPDAIVLADIGVLSATEQQSLLDWVRTGGTLIRFAGPRLASSGAGQLAIDPLLPVRLRAGGRNLGGALSWDTPRTLRPFPENSPFAGLVIPDDVTISAQVLAQPDPELAERTYAMLEDGTPLITGRAEGLGRVLLFHVTAGPDWSSLPLSGLYLQIFDRLLAGAILQDGADGGTLSGLTWRAERLLDGFGTFEVRDDPVTVPGEMLEQGRLGPELPPGLYHADTLSHALNVVDDTDILTLSPAPRSGVRVEQFETAPERPLKPALLIAAICLLLLDCIATLWLSGRLRARITQIGAAGLAVILMASGDVHAQSNDDALPIYATTETVLAYVITGDAVVDRTSRAGLYGLSQTLFERTSIEPVRPVGVNLETDELAFYTFLYWPITPGQTALSDIAITRLNAYMRTGGMILLDTRDGGGTAASGTGRILQRLTAGLDLPPLEIVPEDHVLTRTFYLMQSFPGRQVSPEVYIEAAVDAQQADGLPFRTLNDGVSPVIIGGNDWAAAWAMDENGRFIRPVGRGVQGERQREMALRFGVNLIMYVMTGNYKSDQVHVPALLERLSQ